MASIFCTYAIDIAVTPSAEPFFHHHNCTELIFIRSGNGMVWHGTRKKMYHANQIIVYQKGSQHADDATSEGMQFCIGIDGAAAEYIPVGVWNCSQKILNIIELLHQKVSEPPGKLRSLDMDIIAGYLVMMLRNELVDTAKQSPPPAPEEDICEIAKRELEAHVDTPYNLDQLCSRVFVSKGYLRRLFKEKYGESPLAYLLRKKLDFAEELLKITDLPVQEIAQKIGIDNPFYFSTLFARKKGISPANFRAKHKKAQQISETAK